MPARDAATLLQQLIASYRRRITARFVVGTLAGLGCVGLGVWRLLAGAAARPVAGAVGLCGALGVAAWQWRRFRQARLNRRRLLERLDETLGLHARLLTAAEFADAPEPPALYPRLLEETAKSLPEASRQLPAVIDRPLAVFAIVALLLLLWPIRSTPPSQLAMRPSSVTPPPPELQPPQPDQPTPSSDQRQGQSGASGDRSGASQDRQPQEGKGSGEQQDSSGQSNSQSDAQGSQGQADAKASSAQQREQGEREGRRGQASAKADSSDAQEGAQERSSSGSATQLAKLAQAAGAQQGGALHGARHSLASEDGAGSVGGASSAEQELLKAQIQQLLKELSSELKEVQAELQASQSDQHPNPMAGASTDPNLYEPRANLERASGSRLPLQLEVDTQAASSTRKGGGVGKPSGEVAEALPQQLPEEASLSDVRTTEPGVEPQAVPPEYRPVFERLSR